jgi:hypothetical protein
LLRALVEEPPPPHDGDGYWVPLAHVVVPRWTLIAGELLLIVVALAALVLARDGLVTRLASRDRRSDAPRGAGLVIAALCYVLAVAAAIVVERLSARGHPAPWLHAPLRALVADVLVIGGVIGLASRAVARHRPWLGVQRYRNVAVIACALVGSAWLVVGAAELAWVWLVPAAVIAIAPPRAAFVALVASLLPIACVLSPPQLREAAWNGFLPSSLPLSLLVGIVAVPTFATAAWWLRSRPRSGPLGTLVLGMGCGLAVVVGLAVAATSEPACSSVKFERFHLACERV